MWIQTGKKYELFYTVERMKKIKTVRRWTTLRLDHTTPFKEVTIIMLGQTEAKRVPSSTTSSSVTRFIPSFTHQNYHFVMYESLNGRGHSEDLRLDGTISEWISGKKGGMVLAGCI
jgi:hypothetical protein